MKLAAITCVRNESDILETFVRVNSSFINTFIFVDDSDDRSLYRLLSDEGFNIIVLDGENKKPPYNQDQMIMKALDYAKNEFDYFLPLDVDEFPKFKDIADAEDCLKDIEAVGYYSWETYIPLSLEFDSTVENGLITCFGKRSPEGRNYQKVVIAGGLDQIKVSVGAHGVTRLDGSALPSKHIDRKLAHFPVRSFKQILKKNISAVYGLLRKNNRLKGEGYHVIEVMQKLRNSKYDLSDLQSIAIGYANNGNCGIGESPDWISPYRLRYQSDVDFSKGLLDIVVDSWLNPFEKENIKDLINNL